MTLRQRQSVFALKITILIQYIYSMGYSVTYGDAARMDRKGHKKNSAHYSRLAKDLNLFDKNGRYLRKTEDHRLFGEFWKFLGGIWGGDFEDPDGNHYEWPRR